MVPCSNSTWSAARMRYQLDSHAPVEFRVVGGVKHPADRKHLGAQPRIVGLKRRGAVGLRHRELRRAENGIVRHLIRSHRQAHGRGKHRIRCAGVLDHRGDDVGVKVAGGADVAHRQDVPAFAAVKTSRWLHHLAAVRNGHHPIPGHVRNGRRGGNQIRLGNGNQARPHRNAGTVKIAGDINRVAVHPQGGEIGEITVVRVGLKQESLPRPGRAAGGGNRQQKIIGLRRRIPSAGGQTGVEVHLRRKPPLRIGIVNHPRIGHAGVGRNNQPRVGPEFHIGLPLDAYAVRPVVHGHRAIDELHETGRPDHPIGVWRQRLRIRQKRTAGEILSNLDRHLGVPTHGGQQQAGNKQIPETRTSSARVYHNLQHTRQSGFVEPPFDGKTLKHSALRFPVPVFLRLPLPPRRSSA